MHSNNSRIFFMLESVHNLYEVHELFFLFLLKMYVRQTLIDHRSHLSKILAFEFNYYRYAKKNLILLWKFTVKKVSSQKIKRIFFQDSVFNNMHFWQYFVYYLFIKLCTKYSYNPSSNSKNCYKSNAKIYSTGLNKSLKILLFKSTFWFSTPFFIVLNIFTFYDNIFYNIFS